MTKQEDRSITPEERAEIAKRKVEVAVQKRTKNVDTLSDLKREVGIPEKRRRK